MAAGNNTVYGGNDSTAGGGTGDAADDVETGDGNDLIFGGNGNDRGASAAVYAAAPSSALRIIAEHW